MGFLDDLGKGISGLADEAGGALGTGSKRMNLSSLRGQIERAHSDLGKAMYGARAAGTALPADAEAVAASIDQMEAQASALQAEIDAEAQQSAAPVAGVAAAPEAPPLAAAPKTCSNCGAAVDPDATICRNCTSPVD